MNRVLLLALLAALTAACHKNRDAEGPLERAGKSVDRAASKTGQALQTAAEKTGKAAERAAEKTGTALQKAGQKLKGEDDVEKKP